MCVQCIEDIVVYIWWFYWDMVIVLWVYYCGSGWCKNECWEMVNLFLFNVGSGVIFKIGYMELVCCGEDCVCGFIEGMGFFYFFDRLDLCVV